MSSQKKRKTRKAQMFQLLEQQIESGISQQQFCKDHQISIATFGYWRKQFLQENFQEKTASLSSSFIPLKIKEPTPIIENTTVIEIQLPNQIILRCPNWSIHQLPTLISQLQKIEKTC